MLTSSFYLPNKIGFAEESSKEQRGLQNIEDLEAKTTEELSNEHTLISKSGNNDYTLKMFDDVIQTQSGDDWKRVNTNFKEISSDKISTESTDLTVKFDSEIDNKDPMLVVGENKEESISFTLKGMESDNQIISINKSDATIDANKLTHENILTDIDLRHTALNSEVKEDIILNKPVKKIGPFVYEIKTTLIAKMEKNGSISFKNSSDKLIYTMPEPMMSDSNINPKSGLSSESKDISYSIKPIANGYELRLSPSIDWINDNKRVYPIYIDPSITKDASLDTFVSSASPESNFNKYWNSALAEYVLRVGKYDSGTGTNYSFIKMPSLSDLRGAIISDASLKSYVKWSYSPDTKTGMWIDSVNSNWSETALNWNTRPTSSNISSTSVSRNQWANFDVTSAIKTIANGSRTDYGFKLHANGNGQTFWKQLTASENSKNKTSMNVSYSYPQMGSLKASVFQSNIGSDTGYINLSWPSAKYATNYRLQLYNGKGWRTIYNGTSLSYSTKDKRIWPKPSQYGTLDELTGGIAFRNGDGMEFPLDPSPMYTSSSGVESTSKSYQFRVVADYKLGSSPVSAVTKQTFVGLIPETPIAPIITDNVSFLENDEGFFEVEWDEIEGASSYDLEIFNGNNYERIPVGNSTKWSSKGKRIFPTPAELETLTPGTEKVFHSDFSGSDFLTNPKELYKKNSPTTAYHNTNNYYVKVVAKSSKGESKPSAFTRIYFPMRKVDFSIDSIREGTNDQNINLGWDLVDNAAGYLIYMYNGKTYQIVDDVEASTIQWSTKGKNIWPKSDQGNLLRGTQKDGEKIPLNPESLYEKNGDRLNFKSNYSFKVVAYRFTNKEYSPYTTSYYIGKGNGFADYSREVEFSENYVDFPEDFQVEGIDLGDQKGAFNLSWSKVNNATGYKISIFNGIDFKTYDVGNVENWSTEGKGIFPTKTELSNNVFNLHSDGLGTDFDHNATDLYKNAKYTDDEDNMFQFKVTAYRSGQDSSTTSIVYSAVDDQPDNTDTDNQELTAEQAAIEEQEYANQCPNSKTTSECMLELFKNNIKHDERVVNEIEQFKKSINPEYSTQEVNFQETFKETLDGLQSRVASEELIDQITEIEEENKLANLSESEQLLAEESDEVEASDYDAPLNLQQENLEKESTSIASIKKAYVTNPEQTDLSSLNQYSFYSETATYYSYKNKFILAEDYLKMIKSSTSATKQSLFEPEGLRITPRVDYATNYDKKKKKYEITYAFTIENETGRSPKSYTISRSFYKGDSRLAKKVKSQKDKVEKKYVRYPNSKLTYPTHIFDQLTLGATKFRNVKYTIKPNGFKGYEPLPFTTGVHLHNKKGVLYPRVKDPYTKQNLPFPNSTLYPKVSKAVNAAGRRKWDNHRDTYRKIYEKENGGSPNGKGSSSWKNIDCHHIRQLDHGGDATAYSNIIPLVRKQHYTVTSWWSSY